MKTLNQIKKELHECIDGVNDEKVLLAIYEDTLKHLKDDSRKDKSNENDLVSNYAGKGLDDTIKHGNSDENNKEFKKSIARWFNDGGKNPC